MSTSLPLPQFYASTLLSLSGIYDDTLLLSDPATQSRLAKALDELYLIQRMISSLGLFSENESADEVGERELIFMSVTWVIGASEEKGGLGGREDRIACLNRAETAYTSFIELLDSYSVLNPEEQAESSAAANPQNASRDPAKRREIKIRQYKREKELRERISSSIPTKPDSSSSPITFILGFLPSPSDRPSVVSTSTGSTSVNPEDNFEGTRPSILLLSRLLHTLTLSSLQSMKMEIDLLSNAPASISIIENSDNRSNQRNVEEKENTWKLDRRPGDRKPRELISGNGKILRPFTILPSTVALSDRERIRGEVFRQSWRLPTMTIDEYLEEEQRRGNIITGGGQASYDAPTESELLELAAEEDGTVIADEKQEQKRLKEEKWALYTDDNKRGAGNTMNRG